MSTFSIRIPNERTKPLSSEEQILLVKAYQNGNHRAGTVLIERNSRFVLKLATMYRGRGLEIEDLFQEGIQGILRAAELFDSSKKLKFLTYAVWWVRQAMIKALQETGRLIRVPANHHYKNRVRNRPDSEEEDNERVDLLYRTSKLVSFSGQLDERDIVQVHIEASPETKASESEFSAQIAALVETLPPKLRYVIARRFGMNGGEAETLQDIADELGVSRERARQLENTAKATLKKRVSNFHLQERLP